MRRCGQAISVGAQRIALPGGKAATREQVEAGHAEPFERVSIMSLAGSR
jgi:hypothetical protein